MSQTMSATTSAARPRPTPPSSGPLRPLWQEWSARVAVGAGAFCLALAVVLSIQHLAHRKATHPLDHPRLVEWKHQLAKEPQNEALKQQIRALDLELRVAHDRYLARLARGQWLLLAGGALFLAGLQGALWRQKIARPGKVLKPAGWQALEVRKASLAVAVLGAVLGLGSWWLAGRSVTALSPELAQAPKPAEPASASPPAPIPATPFPGPEEVARNWGRFRGPAGAGVSGSTNTPVAWNIQTGEGVLWKVKTPGMDFNSPVVWNDRVFITTATATRREVVCYDLTTGKLLWQKPVENVPGGGAPVDLPEISGGPACPTAAVDGRRVYAMFANGDVAAFDFNGNLAWSRGVGPITNQYGHAASLDLWQDRLIIQLDHGDSDAHAAKLIALNTSDGKTVWEKPRQTHNTWSTPVAVEAGGKPQIITLGLPHAIAYSPADGAELWRVDGVEGEITPSPILAGGLVLIPVPSLKLMAVKPDGTGDVTKSHVAWEIEEGVPDITSPVSDGERVYMITTGGTLTAWSLKDGKKVWEREMEMEFRASPCIAGRRLYLCAVKGTMVVLETGPEYKELARSEIGEEVSATPAFVNGRIIVRGKSSLFCFGTKGS